MSHVTLDQTAIINVPIHLWVAVRRALQTYHQERHSDYGEDFITNSNRCDLRKLYRCETFIRNEEASTWLMGVRMDLPTNFTGAYHFKLQTT